MNDNLRLLVVEDSVDDFDLLLREIRKAGFIVSALRVETADELEKSLIHQWDVVISDNTLPTLDAPSALKITRSFNHNVPFLIVSGTIGEEAAVEAMRVGANDYILKDNLKRLIPAIKRELKESNNRIRRGIVEQKLAKSQKMYQFLSGSIKDCFIALDHQLNIIHWNDAAKKEFKIYKKSLSASIFSIFPEWENGKVEKKIRNAELKSKSENISFEHASREFFDGSIYPSEEGLSIILRKVTEKKRAEENLRKLNHELETLMYRISHDLKGPVASISGLINIGKLDFRENNFQSYLGMLEKSAFKLKDTLEELLDVTRIKQGDIVAEEVDLAELIRNVAEGLKFQDGFQEIDFKIKLAPEHHVYTDRRLLMSIFHNLLDNAIKYKASGRTKAWVSITAQKKDHELCIQVEDNGEGIEANLQHKVFDMFFRANESSSGSGLGLYIVKNAIDKACGSIALKSNKGKGCLFNVVIPNWSKKLSLKQ